MLHALYSFSIALAQSGLLRALSKDVGKRGLPLASVYVLCESNCALTFLQEGDQRRAFEVISEEIFACNESSAAESSILRLPSYLRCRDKPSRRDFIANSLDTLTE